MTSAVRVAGLACIAFAVTGIVWVVLESTPPRLGFEDTDDPAVMVRFIRTHPQVFVQAGVALIVMAVSLGLAVVASARVIARGTSRLDLQSASVFGVIAAALFLFGGAIRVGSSGPLLHMADLREEWGAAAYVAAQVASQAVLIAGILALCLWAVGLSVMGLRTGALPAALCLFGIVPGTRIVMGTLGSLGLLPGGEILWIVGMLSIPGTMLWCLLLGLVLTRRGFGQIASGALKPMTADA